MFVTFSIAFVAMRLNAPLSFLDPHESLPMQKGHDIAVAMVKFAEDHHGKFPAGNSSTEIFQQLLDGGYVRHAEIYYLDLKGKLKPHGSKLQPENVGWDVTDSIVANDPDGLPLVFTTGYKINYAAGGKAHPLGEQAFDGIFIFYKSHFGHYQSGVVSGVAQDIPIIDSTVPLQGKTYRQLTPDGPLP